MMKVLIDSFDAIIKLSIYGAITALIIFIFKKILSRRISAKLHYFIWFILLLRILVPIMPQSYLSIFNATKPIESNYSQFILQVQPSIIA
ncbi:MAG: hypothetical protein FWC47_17620, partial [Oscillospiraceae bacterium]|nr:hypothetical protein [Oscillospiraceae bacterium]